MSPYFLAVVRIYCLDFGLDSLRKPEFYSETSFERDDHIFKLKRNKVYVAPEVPSRADDVEEVTSSLRVATGPGDVYAFGVILVEIATREDPYGVSDAMILQHRNLFYF